MRILEGISTNVQVSKLLLLMYAVMLTQSGVARGFAGKAVSYEACYNSFCLGLMKLLLRMSGI